MNILVKTYFGKVVMRPDTSWERLNGDFYVPDFVSGLKFSPVLFARISRPGKAISTRFADRYYDAIGLGLLLYPSNFLDGSPEGFASALCLTHSSYLPIEVINKEAFTPAEFSIDLNGEKVFKTSALSINEIESAISSTTEISLIRKGDIVAIELSPILDLTCETSCVGLNNPWLGKSEFQIIF